MSNPYMSIDPQLFTHRAGAEVHIDLSAITQNYLYLQSKVAPAQCGGVVKADAYGLGMVEVAKALYKAGCRHFFVAHLDEGIALRSVLNAECTIYILHGFIPNQEALFIQNRLTPILNDIQQLKSWSQLCNHQRKNHPAAVQFDTGMSRFGIGQDELAQLSQISWDFFRPCLAMSHLACADTPDHPANQQQLTRFNTLKALIPCTTASLSASSGIFLGKDFHFDLVRPGIALYGGNPTPNAPNPMRAVVTLQGKILQTRSINTGDFIGYGATFVAPCPMKIATLSIGYADGFFRSLSPKLQARSPKYPEIPLPLLGRISMDSLCVDVTNLPENSIQSGDIIELIGKSCSINDVARTIDTISYEILTALGDRYHRIYTS
ncbi:alanine racemase [Commensalibacter oyaizuii]|uniref:Alanine racemase n=1 Tax=Commensalibacter oyaizuii TaxID=3043873 RepID=A0ABT6Q391_9PROT|nr:alanine racemase [Commensalibacter sp. TBRC 16381]MDI2090974.1 alanine racemase [Commensalibacter sp. TBRC 16381]